MDFVKQLTSLIEQGESVNAIRDFVIKSRKLTGRVIGSWGISLDSLLSMLVVDGDLADLGQDLTRKYQSAKSEEVRTRYKDTCAKVAKLKDPYKLGSLIIGEGDKYLLGKDDIEGKALTQAAKKYMEHLVDFAHQLFPNENYDASFGASDISDQQAFIAAALDYFTARANYGLTRKVSKTSWTGKQVEKTEKQAFSPVTPIIATVILLAGEDTAKRPAVEKTLEMYLGAMIANGKAGKIYASGKLGDKDPASIQKAMLDATRMVDEFLYMFEEVANGTALEELQLPDESELPEDKSVGALFHDIAHVRKMLEQTSNPDQKVSSLDQGGAYPLAYVAKNGLLVPVFEGCQENDLIKWMADQKCEQLALLYAFAAKDKDMIWTALKAIDAQLEEHGRGDEERDLHLAVASAMAAKYCGAEDEMIDQIIDAYADVFVEAASNYDSAEEFAMEVRDIVYRYTEAFKLVRQDWDTIATDEACEPEVMLLIEEGLKQLDNNISEEAEEEAAEPLLKATEPTTVATSGLMFTPREKSEEEKAVDARKKKEKTALKLTKVALAKASFGGRYRLEVSEEDNGAYRITEEKQAELQKALAGFDLGLKSGDKLRKKSPVTADILAKLGELVLAEGLTEKQIAEKIVHTVAQGEKIVSKKKKTDNEDNDEAE